MSRVTRCVLVVLVVGAAATLAAQPPDPRDRYGTKNMAVARHIDKAMGLLEAKKPQEALKELDLAIRLEPRCQMAYYQQGITLVGMGELARGIAAYRKAYELAADGVTKITVKSAINVGLIDGKLNDTEGAVLWFNRAVLADPGNTVGLRGKAFGGLAVSYAEQGERLTAALAVAQALADDPGGTDQRMAETFLRSAKDDQLAVARLLVFPDQRPELTRTRNDPRISPISLKGPDIAERISQLLSDPRGKYVVAIAENQCHYYVIETPQADIIVRKIPFGMHIACASLAGRRLYLLSNKYSVVCEVDPMTGKVVRSFSTRFKGGPARAEWPCAHSIAAFPRKHLVFFPADSQVWGLNLATGKFFATKIPGRCVAGDPKQRFLYSCVPAAGSRGEYRAYTLIGRRFGFRLWKPGQRPTGLFQSLVTPNGLVLTAARFTASVGARSIEVSPDGHWVSVPGREGWSPKDLTHAGGLGIPVFRTDDLTRVQAFFATPAPPLGVAFNPVTRQLAVVDEKYAVVFPLACPSPEAGLAIEAKHGGPVVWSGGGDFLVLAMQDGGVKAYINPRSPSEKQLARVWWQDLDETRRRKPEKPDHPDRSQAFLGDFTVHDERPEVGEMVIRAIEHGRKVPPAKWPHYLPYRRPAARNTLKEAVEHLKNEGDIGFVIYRLRSVHKSHPGYLPASYYLAFALARSGQNEEALRYFLKTVRGDTGRTDLTWRALCHMADIYVNETKEIAAIYCLASAMMVDQANPGAVERIMPLLKRHRFPDAVRRIAELDGVVAAIPTRLPDLPIPRADDTRFPPDKIYEKAVASVVLLRKGRVVGTGFCVGEPGVIVTNRHVLQKEEYFNVYPFEYVNGEMRRMRKYVGRVIYRSDRYDLAVLRLSDAPDSLKVLDVAAHNPRPGEKVYAIGNPGLGREILEQSITEGIISAASRHLGGLSFLQHTAAINPGNSGGPLLNDRCQVVGVNTLKAGLENVGFAIPVETIREIFKERWAEGVPDAP